MDRNEKYFCFTIDTEADNAWSFPENIKLENFKEIPRLQTLCEKYNVIPTYLLSYEYAGYRPAIEYLKPKLKNDKCEIGHHLHVWTTPPFENEKNGIDMDWIHAYQFELPDNLFEAKSNNLHHEIEKNFEQAPTSHRAGRWGIDARTISWMKKNGYIVDTSVVPKINWNANKGRSSFGPDFSKKSIYPEFDEISGIMEIPVSINFPVSNMVRKFANKNLLTGSIERKIINKLNLNTMLRPNPKYSLKYYDKFVNKLIKYKMPVINMMMHSSELARGCSPFTRSKDEYEKIWVIIEKVFELISNSKYIPSSLSKCAKNLEKDIWIKQNIQY